MEARIKSKPSVDVDDGDIVAFSRGFLDCLYEISQRHSDPDFHQRIRNIPLTEGYRIINQFKKQYEEEVENDTRVVELAQNFSFMKELVPAVVSGEKRRTCRAYSEFRKKMKVGDTMHICTGLRTKNYQKLFDATLVQKFVWDVETIPTTTKEAKATNVFGIDGQPIKINGKEESWFNFALNDGFSNYDEFIEYFSNHPKKTTKFICYIFEKIQPEEDKYRKITEF